MTDPSVIEAIKKISSAVWESITDSETPSRWAALRLLSEADALLAAEKPAVAAPVATDLVSREAAAKAALAKVVGATLGASADHDEPQPPAASEEPVETETGATAESDADATLV